VALAVSVMPDCSYREAARLRRASVLRSTALATSAGEAGSGIRLAREETRAGVRATARLAARAVSSGSSLQNQLVMLLGFDRHIGIAGFAATALFLSIAALPACQCALMCSAQLTQQQ
jgi:hypothetical protein